MTSPASATDDLGASLLALGQLPLKDWQFAENARRVLAVESPDLVLAHDIFALPAAAAVARETGAALIYDAVDVPDLRERLGTYLREQPADVHAYLLARNQELVDACDDVWTVSPGLGTWLEQAFGLRRRPRTIRNVRGYERVPRSDRLRRDAGVADDERLILYLNTAAPGYGLEAALEAVAALGPSHHVAVLGFVPEGDFRDELARLADELGLTGRLHLLPRVDPEDLPSYISGVDVGLIALPLDTLNARVALPNRLFDMVMARVPVVSVEIADIAAVLERYGFGVTFPAGDPGALTRRLAEVLEADAQTALRAAAEAAAAELCWEREKVRLPEALHPLMGEGPGTAVILARKNLSENQRVKRFAAALRDLGHRVIVAAPVCPDDQSPHALGGVEYLTLAQGGVLKPAQVDRARAVTLPAHGA